jgi:hypothetical protein
VKRSEENKDERELDFWVLVKEGGAHEGYDWPSWLLIRNNWLKEKGKRARQTGDRQADKLGERDSFLGLLFVSLCCPGEGE